MSFYRFNVFVCTFLLISFVYSGCRPTKKISPIDQRDKSGWTLLCKSISAGDLEKVKELLADGADINTTNGKGYSPLMVAALQGNEVVFLELLKRGADPLIVGRAGATVRKIAVMQKEDGLIRLLDAFERFKESDPNDIYEQGWPVIVYKASLGDLDSIKVLLMLEADINAVNPAGWSTLMIAIRNGQTEVARFLIEKGSDLTVKSEDGNFTALSIAERMGNAEIIKFLKQKIKNPDQIYVEEDEVEVTVPALNSGELKKIPLEESIEYFNRSVVEREQGN